jgi:UDP-N-acetylglucosamine 2-epimerase (hydrolysing)
MKRISFLTGTRADYGKLKALMKVLAKNESFDVQVLVTGMHLLPQYGMTVSQIISDNIGTVHLIPNNTTSQTMESTLSRTIEQLATFFDQNKTDLLIIHGDRIEALAGAIVGSLRNLPTAHIEGGEVSGTVDGLIRHSISKLSHLHFVSNETAKNRVIQLGEQEGSIFVIGSPDVDVMLSDDLPSITDVKDRYSIPFDEYAIAIFHPVTNEISTISNQITQFCKALQQSNENYIVIKPNNDLGTEIVQSELHTLQSSNKFLHLPSMRFEYFLTLLRHSRYIIGNSSAGVREASYYGVPAINVGTRQKNRNSNDLIVNTSAVTGDLMNAIDRAKILERKQIFDFGEGNAAIEFLKVLQSDSFWPISTEKEFVDLFEAEGRKI